MGCPFDDRDGGREAREPGDTSGTQLLVVVAITLFAGLIQAPALDRALD